jgi:biopolymer transport protein ExbD
MVKIKKGSSKGAEIPTGSMADIAFLLLLFFLVATVIDVDTGIGISLPEYVPPEEQELAEIPPDRMAAINVNENGDVLLDKKIISIPQIKDALIPRIVSKLDLPAKKKLIVSIKTDRLTNYNLYIQTLDQVRTAYAEVKDQVSQDMFNMRYKDLVDEQQKEVKAKVYEIISIAEPEQVK